MLATFYSRLTIWTLILHTLLSLFCMYFGGPPHQNSFGYCGAHCPKSWLNYTLIACMCFLLTSILIQCYLPRAYFTNNFLQESTFLWYFFLINLVTIPPANIEHLRVYSLYLLLPSSTHILHELPFHLRYELLKLIPPPSPSILLVPLTHSFLSLP